MFSLSECSSPRCLCHIPTEDLRKQLDNSKELDFSNFKATSMESYGPSLLCSPCTGPK